jgi:hypothetical protein
VQDPGTVAPLQLEPEAQLVLVQQTPSTQLPLAQLAPVEHAVPGISFATHAPALQ